MRESKYQSKSLTSAVTKLDLCGEQSRLLWVKESDFCVEHSQTTASRRSDFWDLIILITRIILTTLITLIILIILTSR